MAVAIPILAPFCTRAQADVVFAWNEALLHCVATGRVPVAFHLEARAGAMLHLAMLEAIDDVSRGMPVGEPLRSAQRAAAAHSAQAILTAFAPARAQEFAALAARHLAAIPDAAAKARGAAAGAAAAARTLQLREHDQWSGLAFFSPPAGPEPEITAQPSRALLRGDEPTPSPWLEARPFCLKSVRQFPVVEPRTLRRDGSILFEEALLHSRLFAGVDAGAVADDSRGFWSQRPLIVWNRLARQMAAGSELTLPEQARLLAAVNVAIADATVSTLHWRYTLGTWRAMTADVWEPAGDVAPMSADILARIDDMRMGSVRRETQRVLIPPTPNYPSVHATVAGAAQAVLAGFFRSDERSFTLPLAPAGAAGDPPRSYGRISAAAKECAFVASLDGRHCREACVSGYNLGAAIGGYAARRVARR